MIEKTSAIFAMDNTAGSGFKELLTGLRISLENGATYSTQHTVFLKSLEKLKMKLDTILASYRAIEVMVAPSYLIIEDIKFEKDSLYEHVAHFLHIRTIKSIKFERGVEFDELRYVISKMSLRPRDILEEGGMTRILQDRHIQNISIAALDYSDILHSTKEDKDVWAYLLRKAVDNDNEQEIDGCVKNFERMLRSVDMKNVLGTGEFQKVVEDFLAKLQQTNETAFIECVKTLCEALARQPEMPGGISLPERLTGFLQSLNAEDFADVLLAQWLAADTAHLGFLELSGKLLTPECHEAIALFLGKKIEGRLSPSINLEWLTRINDLLSGSRADIVCRHYAPVILRCKNVFTKEDIFHFGQKELPWHYRAVLLGLFAEEEDEGWLNLIIDEILAEGESIPEKDKPSFFQNLFEARWRKKKEGSPLEPILQKVDKFVMHYAEQCVLTGQESSELEAFLKLSSEGTMKAEAYLDKIFEENDFRPSVFKAFFAFYVNDVDLFYQRLGAKLSDTQFLLRLINGLEGISDSTVLGILKNIYSCPNPYVKTEVFKRMQALQAHDKDFLMSVLSDKNSGISLREQALALLTRDVSAKTAAADILLSLSGTFGKDKDLLVENIRMVDRVGLNEAVPFLVDLSKAGFLWWNRKVRNEASRVLEEWQDGKN